MIKSNEFYINNGENSPANCNRARPPYSPNYAQELIDSIPTVSSPNTKPISNPYQNGLFCQDQEELSKTAWEVLNSNFGGEYGK
jgi:hypothetical protein